MVEIVIALLNGLALVVVAIIGQSVRGRLKRVEKDGAATRTQVENNHDTNLREEADERHEENAGHLRQIVLDIGGLRADVRALTARVDRQDLRQDEFEHTQPKPPRKGKHS